MHRVVLHSLPKRTLRELIDICLRLFWYGFLFPRIERKQALEKQNPFEIKNLQAKAERLKGEISVYQAELEATPYLEGTITYKTVQGRKYKRLRWYDETGKRQEKHLSEKKSGNGALSVKEAEALTGNAVRAKELKKEISNRQKDLKATEYKLSIMLGETVQISEVPLVAASEIDFVSRQEESTKLNNNLIHRIPTLVLGESGIGKNHLVDNVLKNANSQVITINNLRAPKITLIDEVLQALFKNHNLFIDGNRVLKENTSFDDLKKTLNKKSVSQLIEIAYESLQGGNYIFYFQTLTGLTATNKIILEKLIDAKAMVIACDHALKRSVDFESIYRKFDKLTLSPLKDADIDKIITQKLGHLSECKHYQYLKTKIINASYGNPGVADKLIQDALSLSSITNKLTEEQIREIQEPEFARKYFDLTPIAVIGIGCFAVLRFVGIGTNDTILYVTGGSAFVLFMAFGRLLMRGTK